MLRVINVVVRAVVLIFLVWLIIALRFSGSGISYLTLPALLTDSATLSQPAERALQHALMGDEAITRASRDTAKKLATSALNTSPLNADAIRILGFVADLEGRNSARKLIETAAVRNIRDVPAHLGLIVNDLQQKDYRGAITNLVSLRRAFGSMFGGFLPFWKAVAAQTEGREALIYFLSQAPPWRTSLLQQLATSEGSVKVPAELLTRLASSSARPLPEEYAPLLKRMVSEGQFDPAYQLWLELMPHEVGGEVNKIYNGAFKIPLTGSPFDWSILPITGVWSGITTTGYNSNKQLRVVFNDYTGQFQNVYQTLLLAPGEYALSVIASTDSLLSRRGLWWRVSCVGGVVLGTTVPVLGTTSAKLLDARFSVPKVACPAQILRLELAARGTLEGAISGEASFDDVAIKRADKLEAR